METGKQRIAYIGAVRGFGGVQKLSRCYIEILEPDLIEDTASSTLLNRCKNSIKLMFFDVVYVAPDSRARLIALGALLRGRTVAIIDSDRFDKSTLRKSLTTFLQYIFEEYSKSVIYTYQAIQRRRDSMVVYVPGFMSNVEPSEVSYEPASAVRIAYIGRYELEKGVDRLFSVSQALENMGIAHEISCFGSGSFEIKQAESIVDYGVTDTPDEVLRECHLLLIPSRSEGAPSVVAESLTLGIPVIALECASRSFEEMICNGGIVVTTSDLNEEKIAAALADAISKITDNYSVYRKDALDSGKKFRYEIFQEMVNR